MYISGINGYLSKFEGAQVDSAVERVQGLDSELDQKVSKTTTINNIPLDGNIVLTAEDIGAVPAGEGYGRSIDWDDNTDIISLLDQKGRVLSNAYLHVDKARWGEIFGSIADQTDLKSLLDDKQPLITSEAMLNSDLIDDTDGANKFATASQLQQIATNTSDISAINDLIPTQASTSNQLADKAFVNSSLSTTTGTFVGTFTSVADLEAYSNPHANDYAFVVTTDSSGNTLYNRYKYTNATNPASWQFEYTLNNSSFTAAQWASIQSGITSSDVTQITTNKNDITDINNTLAGYGNIVTHNTSEFATSAQGTKADTALQSITGSMVTTALGYTPYDSTNPSGYISSAAVSSLTDVTLNTLTDGQILAYDSTAQKWKNTSSAPGGATTLTGLTDVTITNPAQGESLTYDATNSKWINTATSPGGATTLNGLTDVTIVSPSQGEALTYNSTSHEWTNTSIPTGATTLNGLTDVTLTTPSQGQVLSYDATNNKWVNTAVSPGATTLGALTDVTLTTPSQGQSITYDATNSKWVNSNVASVTIRNWNSV